MLYGVDDGRVRVADPATGLQRIPRDEFLEKWRGYAALISYTERFEQAGEKRTSLEWLKAFFSPHCRA